MADEQRTIRTLRQRTPLADSAESRSPGFLEAPCPPTLPRQWGLARVIRNNGGGRYVISQVEDDGTEAHGLALVTAAHGFLNCDASEAAGRDTAAEGDTVAFLRVRTPTGGSCLRAIVLQEKDGANDPLMELVITDHLAGSIVVNKSGRIIGAYDWTGAWAGVNGHAAPTVITTQVLLKS